LKKTLNMSQTFSLNFLKIYWSWNVFSMPPISIEVIIQLNKELTKCKGFHWYPLCSKESLVRMTQFGHKSLSLENYVHAIYLKSQLLHWPKCPTRDLQIGPMRDWMGYQSLHDHVVFLTQKLELVTHVWGKLCGFIQITMYNMWWNHKVYLTHVSWAKVFCGKKHHILL
jgi:hypothetical protein